MICCQSSNKSEIIAPPPNTIIENDTLLKYEVRSFPYNFRDPDKILILHPELDEISGLSMAANNTDLLAINDEKGIIYLIDTKDGSIKDKHKFASSGDYEGIEIKGDQVYILKSNGHIYQYNWTTKKFVERIKNRLSFSNDLEGLAFDKNSNHLLLACKGRASLSKHEKNKSKKAIYKYDLNHGNLDTIPFFTVSDNNLILFVNNMTSKKNISKSAKKKLLSRVKEFSPSGIAIHPLSGNYYILSSVGKVIIVVNQDFVINHVEYLNNNIHYQPEGICFASDGTLYISNEAKGLKAKIFSYSLNLNIE